MSSHIGGWNRNHTVYTPYMYDPDCHCYWDAPGGPDDPGLYGDEDEPVEDEDEV